MADHSDPVLYVPDYSLALVKTDPNDLRGEVVFAHRTSESDVAYVSRRSAEDATRRAVAAARYDHVATQGQVAALNEYVAGLESALAAERAKVASLTAERDAAERLIAEARGEIAGLYRAAAAQVAALAAERARVRELVALLGEVFAWSVEHAPVVGGTRIVPWLDRYRAALAAGEK